MPKFSVEDGEQMFIVSGHHFLCDCLSILADLFGEVLGHANKDECVAIWTCEVDDDFSVGLFCAYHTSKYTDLLLPKFSLDVIFVKC